MNSREDSNGGLLAQLSERAFEDSQKWFGDTDLCFSIPHFTLALTGEVGEFANLVKKIERGSLAMSDAKTRHAMAMEITDVFTYTLLLARLLGIDLEKAYHLKRYENDKRFTEERVRRERTHTGKAVRQ